MCFSILQYYNNLQMVGLVLHNKFNIFLVLIKLYGNYNRFLLAKRLRGFLISRL